MDQELKLLFTKMLTTRARAVKYLREGHPRRVVGYTACPDCDAWSIGFQANGKIVRHSRDFGSVEKVGPGTTHPEWETTICTGSGKDSGEVKIPSNAAKRARE